MLGTVAAIERELVEDGLVHALPDRRDGQPSTASAGREARSSPARSGWSTPTRSAGRRDEARALFERLLGAAQRRRPAVRGVRLRRMRQLGNFPQAFSHVALVNSARNLARDRDRPGGAARPLTVAER